MIMKLEKVAERIKKSNLAIVIGVILFALSSLITITNGFAVIANYYSETLGEKRALLNSISQLSGGVNIKHFDTILGSPVFKNVRQEKFLEYIYVNKYFYIQAVTDQNEKVIFYSVTTREKDFNPEIPFGDWDEETGKQANVILGETTFTELNDTPEIYANFRGAHNHFYTEGYWTGNPGGYRSYFFSLNESGYENQSSPFMKNVPYVVSTSSIFVGQESITDPDLTSFRNESVINTFTVTAPMVRIDEIGQIEPPDLLLGPDYNQVRILDWH